MPNKQTVRERPWMCMGLAVAAGYAFSRTAITSSQSEPRRSQVPVSPILQAARQTVPLHLPILSRWLKQARHFIQR